MPPQEDKDEIINAMRGETKALGLLDTNENCWGTFISRVRQNLHMVFTASPVGEAFRVRSQRFLATVTSTVIDWFQPWPEASLHSVARKFLDGIDLGDENIRWAAPATLLATRQCLSCMCEWKLTTVHSSNPAQQHVAVCTWNRINASMHCRPSAQHVTTELTSPLVCPLPQGCRGGVHALQLRRCQQDQQEVLRG